MPIMEGLLLQWTADELHRLDWVARHRYMRNIACTKMADKIIKRCSPDFLLMGKSTSKFPARGVRAIPLHDRRREDRPAPGRIPVRRDVRPRPMRQLTLLDVFDAQRR